MLGFLERKKVYLPVFGEGESTVVQVNKVPQVVQQFAKSFHDSEGKRKSVEVYGIYLLGPQPELNPELNRAVFPRIVGVQSTRREALDNVVKPLARTFPAIAAFIHSREIGLRLVSLPQAEDEETGFQQEDSTIISSKGHLILDRPFAANLNSEYQKQLVQVTGKKIEDVSDEDLFKFIDGHGNKIQIPSSNRDGKTIITIPGSMANISLLSTPYSYHPLRPFMEQINGNQFRNGEVLVDLHSHLVLEPTNPWFQTLHDRFGSVKGSATLSFTDLNKLIDIENWCKNFGKEFVQYGARELYVMNLKGDVVAHSVFPMSKIMRDEQVLRKFLRVFRTAFVVPSVENRIAVHDLMQELTIQKGVNEPLTPKDYAM